MSDQEHFVTDSSVVSLYLLSTAMDDYVLEFFGSRENAEKYGHLFVLEAEPIEYEFANASSRASTRYRLRAKTESEMAGIESTG